MKIVLIIVAAVAAVGFLGVCVYIALTLPYQDHARSVSAWYRRK